MNHQYSIKWGKVVLLPLSEEDSEKYRIIRNASRDWFVNKGIITAEQQTAWYRKYADNPTEVMFSIYLNECFIGGNSLYCIDKKTQTAEYGRLLIAKEFSGNGYGFLATKAVEEIAKEQLHLKKLFLEVYENNYPALSTYYKAGYEVLKKENQMIKMFIKLD